MAGRPLRVDWHEGDEAVSLKARYRAEERPELRERLHALWLLRTGRSVREVASVLGVHERAVQRWVHWYREGGLGDICDHHQGGTGRAAWLTAAQEAQVAAQAATGAFRTADDARHWIAEHFGVTYTRGGIYGLFERLRCGPKVPRPLHVKASLEAQEAWKKGD